jgi:hypothetical protein
VSSRANSLQVFPRADFLESRKARSFRIEGRHHRPFLPLPRRRSTIDRLLSL